MNLTNLYVEELVRIANLIIKKKQENKYVFNHHYILKSNKIDKREITAPCEEYKRDNKQLLKVLTLILPKAIKITNSVSVGHLYSRLNQLSFKIMSDKDNLKLNKIKSSAGIIVKLDVKDAFPSTTKELLVTNLVSVVGLRYDLSLAIAEACTLNGILPQGFPTSRLLYEICALRIDWAVQQQYSVSKSHYYRYIDDIIFYMYSFKPVEEIKKEVQTLVKEKTSYCINSKKIKLIPISQKEEIWFLSACVYHPNDTKPRTKIKINKKVRAKCRSYFFIGTKGSKESLAIAKSFAPLLGDCGLIKNIPTLKLSLSRKRK